MKVIFLIFFFLSLVAVNGDDLPILKNLDRIETVIYGQIRINESVESRITRLETILFGRGFSENDQETRLRRIMKPLEGDETSDDVSIFGRLCFLEWKLTSKISRTPLLTKAAQLKKTAIGESSLSDPLIFEISKLCSVVFEGARLSRKFVRVTSEIELRGVLVKEISSRFTKQGDEIELEMKSDFFKDDVLIFPAGTIITGNVSRARKAGPFGKNGRISISLKKIRGLTREEYSFKLEKMSLDEEDKTGVAAGATLLGLAVFGPVGAVGGIFVRGKEVIIPAGTEFLLKVNIPDNIPGIFIRGNDAG